MKKKKLIIFVIIIAIILAIPFSYVKIGKRKLYLKTYDYLTTEKGYKSDDFKMCNLRHSFINRFFSFPEWGVDVVFKDEPTVKYIYTFSSHDSTTIVQSGASGEHVGEYKHFEND